MDSILSRRLDLDLLGLLRDFFGLWDFVGVEDLSRFLDPFSFFELLRSLVRERSSLRTLGRLSSLGVGDWWDLSGDSGA